MSQITLRDYLQETEDTLNDGRADEALSRCQQILRSFPEALEAQRLLGEAYLAQGNLEEAQRAFDWVLTNDPEHVVAYCDRALISERSSDYDTALDCYQQAYELSRGNSRIRSEFNKLSRKAGQQGFMFSRAGLARLYMRGDLLGQAIQEWDAILAANPERLDARTGLLETYWREGMYERAEQLASQILEVFPGCLKALLILAYVVSGKNIQRSQELLQQARAMDPDLVQAQEIFADKIATQPADPFLQLLKQPPAKLEISEARPGITPVPVNSAPDLLQVAEPAPLAPLPGLSNWDSSNSWGNESILQTSQFTPPPTQEESDVPIWTPASILGPDSLPKQETPDPSPSLSGIADNAEVWQSLERSQEQPSQPGQSVFEGWSPSYVSQEQPSLDQTAWEQAERQAHPSLADEDVWKSSKQPGESESLSGTWSPLAPLGEPPAPPTWLSMLTQQERMQMSGALPAIPPLAPVVKDVPPASPLAAPAIEAAAPAQPSTLPPAPAEEKSPPREEKTAHIVPPLEEEESFFGPEWLKSIGASTIEAEESQEPAKAITPPEPIPAASVHTPLLPQEQPEQGADAKQEAAPATEREQKIISTLEEIEQSLRAKGFVSHSPNSLAALAQNDSSEQNATLPEAGQPAVPNAYRDVELSSALAELGSLMPQQEATSDTRKETAEAPTDAQQTQAEDPDWMASLRSFQPAQNASLPDWLATPSPALEQQEAPAPKEPEWVNSLQPEQPSFQPEEAQPVAEPDWVKALRPETPPALPKPQQPQIAAAEWSPAPASPEPYVPQALPERAPVTSSPVFEPVAQAQPLPAPSISTSRPEPLLENELETTMKRPAVRLQHLQSRSQALRDASPQEQPSTRAAARSNSGQLGYRDRLLKGYQYQLSGEYDEAMQEYRFVIKGSSELLGEVVSNVRALLKLAPKYAAGYRVLGDAYMRQGEYLQAMEAYNKALTMAKKTRS